MLEEMTKKLEAEGKKEEKLFEEFMCYCKAGKAELTGAISAGNDKIAELESTISETTAEHKQLTQDVPQAKSDREAAKAAIAKATGIREKEAAEYGKTSGDLKTNMAALKKAIAAIDKGAASSFLQTDAAQIVKNYFMTKGDIADVDRNDVLSFLSDADTTTTSSEGLGIMKTLEEEMQADLKELEETEAGAIKDYDALVAAKK